MYVSFVEEKKILVFTGNLKSLKYEGLGLIIDVFPNYNGSSATQTIVSLWLPA